MTLTLVPVDPNLNQTADGDPSRRDRVSRMAAAAFVQRVTDAHQCAGNECHERKQCQRYRRRSPQAPWASFDIERKQYPGPCIHKLPAKFEKKKAA